MIRDAKKISRRITMSLVTSSLIIGSFPTSVLAIEPPRVAKDLNSSRNLINDKSNKQLYDYQIGITDIDPSDERLGTLDKSSSMPKSIIEQLNPKELSVEERKELKVGIKQLPYQIGTYIGWMYIGEVIYPMVDERGVLIPEEKQKKNINPRLAIGLFKRDSTNLDKMILLDKPISNIQLRQQEALASFDFAPYNLGPLGRAFGLRTNVGGCGAGGSLCSNQYLKLFVTQGGQLTEIFNEAVSYFGNIAGSWHKNGTRDHEIIETNGVIKIDKSADNSIPNLLLEVKKNGKVKRRIFKYAGSANSAPGYKSSDNQVINLVDE